MVWPDCWTCMRPGNMGFEGLNSPVQETHPSSRPSAYLLFLNRITACNRSCSTENEGIFGRGALRDTFKRSRAEDSARYAPGLMWDARYNSQNGMDCSRKKKARTWPNCIHK